MTNRVVHGVIVLAISLATVGAIVSGEESRGAETEAAAAQAAGAGVLRSEVHIPAPAGRLGIEIRNGRIDDTGAEVVELPRPVSIRASAIALEAPVIPVGVDASKQFDVPDASTVGWYRHGAAPGEPGASVLAAHVDYGGVSGAFFNLSQLAVGDAIEVILEDGSVVTYQVTATFQYDKSDLPASELFRKDGSPVLQLITCGGTFDPEHRSYEANVVVTAVPVDELVSA